MTVRLALIAAAAIPLTACTAQADREREISAPPVEVTGEPVNCIQTSRIQSTKVHDDYTIDFEMGGDTIYRNTLPNRCAGLGFEERFAHSSSTGQLCNVDTVTVLNSGGTRGPTCGLGQFVPVRYVEVD